MLRGLAQKMRPVGRRGPAEAGWAARPGGAPAGPTPTIHSTRAARSCAPVVGPGPAGTAQDARTPPPPPGAAQVPAGGGTTSVTQKRDTRAASASSRGEPAGERGAPAAPASPPALPGRQPGGAPSVPSAGASVTSTHTRSAPSAPAVSSAAWLPGSSAAPPPASSSPAPPASVKRGSVTGSVDAAADATGARPPQWALVT